MKKILIFSLLFIAMNSFAVGDPTQSPDFGKKPANEKIADLKQWIMTEDQRRDLFVAACLQSYQEPGRAWNLDFHYHIEDQAVRCAYHILDKLAAIDEESRKTGGRSLIPLGGNAPPSQNPNPQERPQ